LHHVVRVVIRGDELSSTRLNVQTSYCQLLVIEFHVQAHHHSFHFGVQVHVEHVVKVFRFIARLPSDGFNADLGELVADGVHSNDTHFFELGICFTQVLGGDIGRPIHLILTGFLVAKLFHLFDVLGARSAARVRNEKHLLAHCLN